MVIASFKDNPLTMIYEYNLSIIPKQLQILATILANSRKGTYHARILDNAATKQMR